MKQSLITFAVGLLLGYFVFSGVALVFLYVSYITGGGGVDHWVFFGPVGVGVLTGLYWVVEDWKTNEKKDGLK